MRLPPELIDLIKDFVWDKVRVGNGKHFYWNRLDLFDGVDASEPEPDPWQLPRMPMVVASAFSAFARQR